MPTKRNELALLPSEFNGLITYKHTTEHRNRQVERIVESWGNEGTEEADPRSLHMGAPATP